MAAGILIPYSPRRLLLPFHERKERWAVLVAHRRFGKTVGCVNDLVRRALLNPRQDPPPRYAYVAPYLAQAKEVAWGYLNHYSRPILKDKNESELWVELANGARIRIHGADNPDRLRGAYLDGVVEDEFADFRAGVHAEIIRPMLADYEGWATIIGTPKGRNEFYNVWQKAQGNPEWFSAMFKASETGVLNAAELEALRAELTPEQFEQELECSFEAALVGAYYGREMAQAQAEGRIREVEIDPALPVHSAWDLGIADQMSIWAFQMVPGGKLRVVDYYEANGFALGHYVEWLEDRGYRGTDYLPHDARARDLTTGRSRVETLIGMKRKPIIVGDHKVMDGINAVRLTLPRCWFDETRTATGLEWLRRYRADYDEKLKIFRDKPRHDEASHGADAFRILCMAWREAARVEEPKPAEPITKPLLATVTMDQYWANRPQNRRHTRV